MADTADASPFSGREIESLVNGCAGSNHALGAGCLLGTDPSTSSSSSSRWLLSALATHWGACSLSNEDFLFLFRYYTFSPTHCPHGPSQSVGMRRVPGQVRGVSFAQATASVFQLFLRHGILAPPSLESESSPEDDNEKVW